jgi:hypothetical protein
MSSSVGRRAMAMERTSGVWWGETMNLNPNDAAARPTHGVAANEADAHLGAGGGEGLRCGGAGVERHADGHAGALSEGCAERVGASGGAGAVRHIGAGGDGSVQEATAWTTSNLTGMAHPIDEDPMRMKDMLLTAPAKAAGHGRRSRR